MDLYLFSGDDAQAQAEAAISRINTSRLFSKALTPYGYSPMAGCAGVERAAKTLARARGYRMSRFCDAPVKLTDGRYGVPSLRSYVEQVNRKGACVGVAVPSDADILRRQEYYERVLELPAPETVDSALEAQEYPDA